MSRYLDGDIRIDIENAVKPRLERWADWVARSPGFSGQVSWYAEYGDREYHSICLIDISDDEGLRTDADICQLPEEIKQALLVYWLRVGTAETHAEMCGCSVSTMYKRLERAYERLYFQWFG